MSNLVVVCANIIQNSVGDFLFVKETGLKSNGKYGLPAGRKEKGESLVDCARREGFEETGLIVFPKRWIGTYIKNESSNPLDHRLVYVYYSSVISGEISTSLKHPEVRYFSYTDVLGLNTKGLVKSPYILLALEDFLKGSI